MKIHVFPPHILLVPTDMGAASNVALGFARIFHEMFKTPVEVLHAGHLELPPYFMSGQVDDLEQELKMTRQAAEAILRKEIGSSLGDDSTVVISDKPALESILEESERLDFGLIIMGTHGRRGAERLMLGSVAERVLHQSRVPALVVRESVKPARFDHIFCPFNFSEVGRSALNYAAEVAEATGARLTVMHAREVTRSSPICELVEESLRQKCKVDEIVVGGEAAKSILEAAQKVEPDLIVMGAEQKSGVLEGLFSSTTERVMQLAKAPLLIVPKL
jgi:nucleotide-binding universal stress UspA family protein